MKLLECVETPIPSAAPSTLGCSSLCITLTTRVWGSYQSSHKSYSGRTRAQAYRGAQAYTGRDYADKFRLECF